MRRKNLLVMTLASALVAPLAGAQEHLVPSKVAQARLAEAAGQREQNAAVLRQVLASPAAAGVLARLGVEPAAVTARLPGLSDSELASLAARAQALGVDPRAGDVVIDLNDILILILIVAIVIVVANAVH